MTGTEYARPETAGDRPRRRTTAPGRAIGDGQADAAHRRASLVRCGLLWASGSGVARGADPAGQQDRHPPDPSSFDAAHAYHREGPEGGRVVFHRVWGEVEAVPASLRAVTLFRGCADRDVLATVAGCLAPAEFEPGDVIVSAGQPADALFVIAHGKVAKVGRGRSGKGAGLAILSGGDHFGSGPVADPRGAWEYTAKALTAVTALTLSRTTLRRLLRLSGPPWKLGEPAHLSRYSTVDY